MICKWPSCYKVKYIFNDSKLDVCLLQHSQSMFLDNNCQFSTPTFSLLHVVDCPFSTSESWLFDTLCINFSQRNRETFVGQSNADKRKDSQFGVNFEFSPTIQYYLAMLLLSEKQQCTPLPLTQARWCCRFTFLSAQPGVLWEGFNKTGCWFEIKEPRLWCILNSKEAGGFISGRR